MVSSTLANVGFEADEEGFYEAFGQQNRGPSVGSYVYLCSVVYHGMEAVVGDDGRM